MVPDHLVFWALIMGTTNALVKTKHKTSAFGIELNARACQQPLMVCMRSPTPVLLATLSDGLARDSKATSQSYFQSIKYSIKARGERSEGGNAAATKDTRGKVDFGAARGMLVRVH